MVKKETKNKTSKFTPLFVIIFSLLGIFFAYFYGYTSSNVQLYANYVALDQEVKSGNNGGFLHGRLDYESYVLPLDAYSKSLAYQHKTIYKSKYYNSYLLSTDNGSPVEYELVTNIQDYSPKTTAVMVRNFWDYDYMESLGLPLFWLNESDNRNNIRPKNNNAAHGSYISASMAYDFVSKNGMLEKNNNDIKAAFNELIADKTYYYTLQSKKIKTKLTINNIYIDEAYSNLLTDWQKEKNIIYENFYKNFCHWNKDAIVTHAPEVFNKGSTYMFDIKENYRNTEIFINDVLTNSYRKEGGLLTFYTRNKTLTSYSNNINEMFKNKQKTNTFWLIGALVCLEAASIIHIMYFTDIDKKKNFWRRMLNVLFPIIPFAVLQSFLYIFLMITKDVFTYCQIFNYLGNVIILIFTVVMVVANIIVEFSGPKKNEKVIK